MSWPPPPAGRAALAAFDGCPPGDRFHVRVRWLTCPVAAIERRVPLRGRVLDLGCGHGLISQYLARCSPARDVLGVDIDPHKIELATAAAGRVGPDNVRFAVLAPGEELGGPWDAVVVADVLYLLDPDARGALLAAAVASLAPEGALLVKETDTAPTWKHRVARFQEVLATRVLRITAGATLDYASSGELAATLEHLGLRTQVVRLDRGQVHPHVLVHGVRHA